VKHKLSITLILLGMFLLTQFIGLFILNQYAGNDLPFGLEEEKETVGISQIILAFALAFVIIFTLMKYKWKFIIRAWFFLVVTLALAITLYAILKDYSMSAELIAIAISVPLAYFKIFKPHILVHNFTELLIYPGIASVFIPILNPLSILGLLILISIYDMWAVWKSGIMQKMAKFQMEELKIFGGFLIPSASKKVKLQIKKIKEKYKDKEIPNKIKNKKFKVNLAILGGGDVIFPIITAGVFMRAYDIIPAIFIIFGALAGLIGLFLISKKGKAYPAMPYITSGIFAGLILWQIFF
jgi:presenilin-like A22 family membrane protease